jgi:hypothetical protein
MRKEMKRLGLLAVLALAGSSANAWADAVATPAATPAPTVAAPVVTMNGMVDTYFSYNFTNSANTANGSGNRGYWYNNTDNSYTLGLAEAGFTATQGNGSGHLTLAYGQDSDLNAFGAGTGVAVEQAYVSYVADQWTFNAGKFVTWMGNEVIESKSNWNYSRSLLFTDTIPVWHTGMSVAFAPSSAFGVTGYITNGWNNLAALTADLGEKTYGLQFMIKPDASWTVALNGILGPNPSTALPYDPSMRYVGEGIVTWTATDKLSIALDAEYGAQDLSGPATLASGSSISSLPFWGVALYGRYQMTSQCAVALRLEELKDEYNLFALATPVAGSYDVEGREATLTFEHAFTPNTLMRLEGRYDYALSGGSIYAAKTGPFAGGSADQLTGTASMVFSY